MRLIPPEFGLRAGDPPAPTVSLVSVQQDATCTTAAWTAQLAIPAASDDRWPASWRAEAAEQHGAVASGIEAPWCLNVLADPAKVTVMVTVSGPRAWYARATALQHGLIEARANDIAMAAWAAWHASLHAGDSDHLAGILWLTAGGHPWPHALEVAARLAAA